VILRNTNQLTNSMKKIYLGAALMLSGHLLFAQCPNPVGTFPYNQDFESGAGGWAAGGTSGTWVLGTPAKTTIIGAASGTNAWITESLTGAYTDQAESFIQSPCFNFSSLGLPEIELKVWWQTEFSYDGVVLQSSIDGGATWQNVGAVGDPNNWYTDNSVSGLGWANSSDAWSGRNNTTNTTGSGGYVTAKHTLTGLAGQPDVLLRFAFGTDGSVTDDGVAIDDIMIRDKPAVDLSVAGISSPATSGCGMTAATAVTIQVANLGSQPQSNIPVSYTFGANPAVAATIPGPIAPGATAQFTFPGTVNLGTPGTYTLAVTVNQAGDVDPSNNSISNYTINSSGTSGLSTFPYNQDFESGPGGWTTGGASGSFVLGTPAKTNIQGAASGANTWVTESLTADYLPNFEGFVESPCFEFASLAAPVIEMKVWWSSEEGYDGAVLQSSIDNGQTWQDVGAVGDSLNWYNDNSINGLDWAGTQSGWAGRATNSSNGYVLVRHDLTGLGGQASVKLRIAFGADGSQESDGFAFDDIRIYDKPEIDVAITGLQPFTAACGLSNSETITLNIQSFGTQPASGFSVSYQLDGGPVVTQPFTGTLAPFGSTAFSFTQTANLSGVGSHNFIAYINYSADSLKDNDTISTEIVNSLLSTPATLGFENGIGDYAALGKVEGAMSHVIQDPAAAHSGSMGLVLDGGTGGIPWQDVVSGQWSPTINPTHFAAAYLCVNTAGLSQLNLSFWMKQQFMQDFLKTNFRITVNGVQVGNTYMPVSGPNQAWQQINVPLTSYLTGGNMIIGFESKAKYRHNETSATEGNGTYIDDISLTGIFTGTAEELGQGILTLQPNPTDGLFSVSLTDAQSGQCQIQVVDVTGRIIHEDAFQNPGSAKRMIDLSRQSKGIYLVKVQLNNQISTQRIMVK
jgi:hypothetical protein